MVTSEMKEFYYLTGQQKTDRDGNPIFNKDGTPMMEKRKSMVGEILNQGGTFRTKITVTRRKGELRFSQHQQHWEPTKEIMAGDEIVMDPCSAAWVTRSTKKLELTDLVALLRRWGLNQVEASYHIGVAISFSVFEKTAA